MKHLDLFSGIGGFALATEMVWENVEHTFCDIEPFSQAILKKHWPQAQIYGDIRQLTANAERERNRGKMGYSRGKESPVQGGKETQNARLDETGDGVTESSIDLLTGGFPCQPFSQAGKRRGTEDDRHLWPEMLRIIREFHPRWVVGENVGGFVTWNDGMVLEQVHTDLEGEGYEVQSFIIPAVSLNAPHRRDRVWIVAHSTNGGSGRGGTDGRPVQKRELLHGEQEDRSEVRSEIKGCTEHDKHAPNSTSERFCGDSAGKELQPKTFGKRNGMDRKVVANSPFFNEERAEREGNSRGRPEGQDRNPNWDENWLEVATRLCTMDDGLPGGLARPKGWRNAALKGAGNAIVPQVAAEIFKTIKEIESAPTR